MKILIFVLALLISGTLFSQNSDSLKLKQFYKEIDSIEYSEVDFIKLKKHYIDDEKKYDFITKKAASGDKHTSDLLNLLSLSYQEAKEEFGEREIKVLIYSYYKSKRILEKFKRLETDFQATNDSLKLKNEDFQKIIDSLKKN